MSTAVVIPARIGATRLPRKPLRDLGGAPLVVRVWQRVARMGVGDRVVVATDDTAIARAVEAAGGAVVLTDAGCGSGTERVAEVARRAEFRAFDRFVNVQGDEPFLPGAFVRAALGALAPDAGVELGTAAASAAAPDAAEILDRPSVVKVVCDARGRALYFSRAPIPWLRDASDARARVGHVLQHVGVYAYTRAALAQWVAHAPHPLEIIERLEQLRPLAYGMSIGVAVVDDRPGSGIDTEDDLEAAVARFARVAATEPAWQ